MNTFEHTIISLYGDKGREWLHQLPFLVQKISHEWNLTHLTPIQTMTYNYVLLGSQKKIPVVLKISIAQERLFRETEALKIFSGRNAVTILNSTKNALLLERLLPGYSLKTYLPERKNDARTIACHVLKKMYLSPFSLTQKNSFPSITDLLKILENDWDLSSEYLIKARFLKDKLLKTSQPFNFLHGDLHHDNILAHGNEWITIDPQGIIGPLISETWAFVIDPISDTQFIAEYFKYPLESVREWYFIRVMLSACWNLEDHLDPDPFLSLAKIIFSFV